MDTPDNQLKILLKNIFLLNERFRKQDQGSKSSIDHQELQSQNCNKAKKTKNRGNFLKKKNEKGDSLKTNKKS